MIGKKTTSKAIIFIFALLAEWNGIIAAETQQCQSAPTTNIYFSNGVNNTFTETVASATAIAIAYYERLQSNNPDEKLHFGVAYNYSRGAADILEVFGQKIEENGGSPSGLTAIQYLRIIEFGEKLEIADPLLDTLLNAYIEIQKVRYFRIGTTENHVQKYRTDLLEGDRVIIFAHSQGNLFSNEAVETVTNANPEYTNSIGIIGVGSPANRVIGTNTYITAHDDRVIDALRITHDVLPSNIDNDPGIFNDHRDLPNHNFLKSYFASELEPAYAGGETLPSRGWIDTTFFILFNNLVHSDSVLGDGAIKVTLEWGFEPDLDLHVYEPNGAHVYYSNLRGISGFLDLDDVTSFGPEHYFVSCDTLEEGTYRVGVNYYWGSNPETARVQITTADGRTQTTQKTLSIAVGSSGDNNPIAIANIVVSKNSDGTYIFR